MPGLLAGGLASAQSRDGEARSIAPQIFQAVEIAFFAMKHVHDDLQVIEHDPLTRRESVNRRGPRLVVLPESGFNLACNRLEMRFRRS